jgi:hypothetical protein
VRLVDGTDNSGVAGLKKVKIKASASEKDRMAGMAKKKEAADTSPELQDGALVKAAKAVGEAAGKIAAAVGVAKPAKVRVPKLEKKNKSGLPRKEKKAAKKSARKSA